MTLVLLATDDGVHPFVDGTAQPTELPGRRVEQLVAARNEWWAVADGHTVVARNGGGDWREVATADERLTSLLPAPGGAICGTADGHLLRLHEGRWARMEGFDAVEGRDTWHAVGSRVPYVRSLTATANGRALLANVHVGGIPRSGNNGTTWHPTIDPDADVHQVRAHPVDPQLVLAAAAVGVAVSHDGGRSWSVTTDGLHATYCRAVAFARESAYVTASDGPFTSAGALYRWRDGEPLERVTDGLPEWFEGNVDTGNLDADGELCALADGDTVYVSDDDGTTWSRLASDVGAVHAVGVRAD